MEIPSIKIGMFEMLAIVVLVVYLGQWIRNKLPILKKYCIPSAVVGGTLISIITCILYLTYVGSHLATTCYERQLYGIEKILRVLGVPVDSTCDTITKETKVNTDVDFMRLFPCQCLVNNAWRKNIIRSRSCWRCKKIL